MPPTIHLVRHAEGYHNAEEWGEKIHDPFLTDKGKGQCEELCNRFPHHDEIDLLVASPLKRTIQTCQIVFAPAVERGQKILLMPLAEESSSQPMDTGSDESTLRECFGDLIDMRHLQEYPGWNNNSGDFKSDHKSLIARAHKLREFLRARPEKNIALVSHGSFAHFIVGNIDHEGAEVTRMWDNAECRSYTFLSEEDKECQMKETEESKNGRRDLEKKCAGYVLSVVGGRRGSAVYDPEFLDGRLLALPDRAIPDHDESMEEELKTLKEDMEIEFTVNDGRMGKDAVDLDAHYASMEKENKEKTEEEAQGKSRWEREKALKQIKMKWTTKTTLVDFMVEDYPGEQFGTPSEEVRDVLYCQAFRGLMEIGIGFKLDKDKRSLQFAEQAAFDAFQSLYRVPERYWTACWWFRERHFGGRKMEDTTFEEHERMDRIKVARRQRREARGDGTRD